ncbi:unnamed protein product [Oppiella nova]|uniref:non-specific serine/threonine protein kinase n=1 Tax=Oppiella nova TaxID=334625 RepID=A0A7R9QJD4_9ACAR|nr:unnamed protein product [Oppiella nova]CAG2166883.1 unnamed protein product [Oppiella nova]
MVYGLGSNSKGQLGLGHNTSIHTPQPVPQLCHKNIHQFINGCDFVLAVNTDNNVIFSFGCNSRGQLGRDAKTAITSEGQVFMWGMWDLTEKEKQNVLNETKSLIKVRSEDLKPDNVLISMDGEIKLCDFGLAKEIPNCDPFLMSKTKHTENVGDEEYMAPEAMTSDYNNLIDIYSLSLIGAQIFGFNKKDITDGNLNGSYTDNIHDMIFMTKMNALLVSMAVNKYRKNGSTDWRQRPECFIKLCDFGLAKEVPNCDPFLMSKANHTAGVGTVDYMAPEAQINEYNHLIDIYSLSLIGAQIFGFDTYDLIEGKNRGNQ